jgi:phage tail-like protein
MSSRTLKVGTGEVNSTENEPSRYLQYLPAIYSENEFMGRFLKIFEDVLTPVEQTINQIPLYFDPKLAPEEFLTWLAFWLDLVLDQEWPAARRRRLIRHATELYQWRGTRRGLERYLEIYAGVCPIITEHFGGIQLGEESRLGVNTILGDGRAHCFTVRLELEESLAVDEEKVRAIIEAEKPAHAAYELEIVSQENSTS